MQNLKKCLAFMAVQLSALFLCAVYAQLDRHLQDSLRQKIAHHGADTVKVNALNKLAQSYLVLNQDSVMFLTDAATKLAVQLKYPRGIADALIYTGASHRLKGDYATALERYLKGAAMLEDIKEGAAAADAYLQVAQVYKDLSGPNKTEEYLDKGIFYSRQSYTQAEDLRDTAEIVGSLNMMGIFYFDKSKSPGKGQYADSAFGVYHRALDLIRLSGKGIEITGKLYNNISQVYLEARHDYPRTLEYAFKAAEFNKGNFFFPSLTYNYSNISGAYISLHNYPQALYYARQMLNIAQQIRRPERVQNAYNALYHAFNAMGRYDSALRYYMLQDALNDSLTNVRKTEQVLGLQTKYESAKKEAVIARLQIEGRDKNRQILLLLVASLVLGILAAAMIMLYRRVKKQRSQIADQSLKLELMMKELHHRVKNNLQIVSSLLGLQMYKLQDEGTITVLRESQLRVQAMSFIHQRLYKNETLTAVNMNEYLTDLTTLLLSTYGYDRSTFDLSICTDREMLDIEQALPIGLIINEMATNALKYAYEGVKRPALHLSITDEGGELVVRVKDNGRGLDEAGWKQKSASFGKQLIGALCKQLRARQSLIVDGGAQFIITIPKQAA